MSPQKEYMVALVDSSDWMLRVPESGLWWGVRRWCGHRHPTYKEARDCYARAYDEWSEDYSSPMLGIYACDSETARVVFGGKRGRPPFPRGSLVETHQMCIPLLEEGEADDPPLFLSDLPLLSEDDDRFLMLDGIELWCVVLEFHVPQLEDPFDRDTEEREMERFVSVGPHFTTYGGDALGGVAFRGDFEHIGRVGCHTNICEVLETPERVGWARVCERHPKVLYSRLCYPCHLETTPLREFLRSRSFVRP